MEKHKVKIPEGYEVESVQTHNPCYMGNRWKETTVKFKPIKKQLPKTFKEYLRNNRNIPEIKPFEILMPSKDINSFRALIKLVQLRDHYNDGYDYNLTNEDEYIFINPVSVYRKEGSHDIIMGGCGRGPLMLRHDIALEFYTNFTDLLETAKPLL